MTIATTNQHRFFMAKLFGLGYDRHKISIIKANIAKKLGFWTFGEIDRAGMMKAIDMIDHVKENKLLSDPDSD